MKKTIVKGSIALGQLATTTPSMVGSSGVIGYVAGNYIGFERGKNVVEVIGNEHIVAGGDAEGVVKTLKASGKNAEVEQYSEAPE